MRLSITAVEMICVVFFIDLLKIILLIVCLERWLMWSNFPIISTSATKFVSFLLAQATVMVWTDVGDAEIASPMIISYSSSGMPSRVVARGSSLPGDCAWERELFAIVGCGLEVCASWAISVNSTAR